MLDSVPRYSSFFPYRTFLQTIIRAFQLWVRDRGCPKNTCSLVEHDFFVVVVFWSVNKHWHECASERAWHPNFEMGEKNQSNLLQNEANRIFLPRDDGSVLNRIIL